MLSNDRCIVVIREGPDAIRGVVRLLQDERILKAALWIASGYAAMETATDTF